LWYVSVAGLYYGKV